MVKIRVRKEVLNSLDWSWVDYHLFEGYGINFVKKKEMTNCYKLYFETCSSQKEVVDRLQALGVDTTWANKFI